MTVRKIRILVCGGREFKDELLMANTLAEIISSRGYSDYMYDGQIDVQGVTVISGIARGADTMACDFAKFYGIPIVKFPADWDKHGKAAGPIRNQQMIDEGKPDLVVAFPGGVGTADMVRRAKKHNIEVIEVGTTRNY